MNSGQQWEGLGAGVAKKHQKERNVPFCQSEMNSQGISME